jgi:hypothetical protein
MTYTRDLTLMASAIVVALARQYDTMEPGPARSLIGESVDKALALKSTISLAGHLDMPSVDVVA